MISLFITISIMDVVDILLVAFLLYEIYRLIQGTAAFSIFIGIFLFYLAWLLVNALSMQLLGSILGQFIGVGVLALIIVFQQEIRRLFLLIGTRYKLNQSFSLEGLFSKHLKKTTNDHIRVIVSACESMSRTKTGALIAIARNTELRDYSRTGERLNAKISGPLLETIFFKNSPLHDGAVIIVGNKIIAARCILPVTDSDDVNVDLGLRHRAAIGLAEQTDAQVVVVSEEKGYVSYASGGDIKENISLVELTQLLEAGLPEDDLSEETNTSPSE